ncbi:hypothetical protein DFP72DRAFT_1163381 [Ephemerocybe angulata]|uniref:Uncharacterized protein n=1 Tax=Ephemerocybe angulata TaxID=980116 RepID=A0A8H6MCQ0_9AGAR|nr:hypothetical protein DFP72DRAFT_1163381 [Tulosesus angulatus]
MAWIPWLNQEMVLSAFVSMDSSGAALSFSQARKREGSDILALALTILPLLGVLFSAAAANAWVDIDPGLIPDLDEPLPLYSLGAPTFISDQWLESLVGGSFGPARFTKRDNDHDNIVYAYNGSDVVGFVDKETGETRVFPDYAYLEPADGPIDLVEALKGFGGGQTAIPPDDTKFEPVQGASLVGSNVKQGVEGSGAHEGAGAHGGSLGGTDVTRPSPNVTRSWNDHAAEATYLATGYIQRYVECKGRKFPVCGPGSRASIGVGAGNRVVWLDWFWKPAKKNGKWIKPINKHRLIKLIKKILGDKAKYGIKVYAIDTCYFDSGNQYLQSVYRVFADTNVNHPNNTGVAPKLLRYFPVGDD